MDCEVVDELQKKIINELHIKCVTIYDTFVY